VRLFFAACWAALAWAAAPAHAADAVLVFAAASTTEAVEAAIARYREDTGAEVTASFAASSTLARQIETGAPADIFLSANVAWVDYLEDEGLILPESRRDLLGNRLVLVAPADSKVEVAMGPDLALAQLLGDGRLAIGDPDHVPAGRYARAALESLGLWAEVEARTVRAPDVRAALALVARGETPLGIVYATDVAVCGSCRTVAAFPASSHPPIRYPLALVAGRASPAARAFYAFLASPAAAEIFARHGFAVD
jgi:molybdate transport system substrate-binding protein